MSMNLSATAARRLAKLSPLVAAGLLAGGCMSSPTYGTGVSANEQLVNDVTSIVSIAPKRKDPIDYKPRPELVRPASGQVASLPAPQDRVASAQNPDWPESPEQRRLRLRQTADANRDNPNYDPAVINDVSGPSAAPVVDDDLKNAYNDRAPAALSKSKTEEIRKRIAQNNQGDPTKRRYLSEPPLDYRQPAATAATDELGEDELTKERRAKKAATVKGGIRDYIPWL